LIESNLQNYKQKKPPLLKVMAQTKTK